MMEARHVACTKCWFWHLVEGGHMASLP